MSENPSLQERYAAAWCDVKQPELDGANPHYRSRYATLAAVQGCIRKACAKHGIAYAQRVKLENGEAVLVSEVVGAGDALHLSDYPVQFVPNPQSNGSMLTYAKRQLASIDWGICGDEDDDGQNAALPPRQVPRQPPQNQMDKYRAALVAALSREACRCEMPWSTWARRSESLPNRSAWAISRKPCGWSIRCSRTRQRARWRRFDVLRPFDHRRNRPQSDAAAA